MTCETPLSWGNDIQNLFTVVDINHMKHVTRGALDLSSYDSVKIWATKIYEEVSSGAMPPAGSGENAWTADMVSKFGCWIQQGCPQ